MWGALMTHRLYIFVLLCCLVVYVSSTTSSRSLTIIFTLLLVSMLIILNRITLFEAFCLFSFLLLLLFRFTHYNAIVKYDQERPFESELMVEVKDVKINRVDYQRFIVKPINQQTHMLITHFDELSFGLVEGQQLAVTVEEDRREILENPGSFDYESYLLTENVTAQRIATHVTYIGERFYTPLFTLRASVLEKVIAELSETSSSLVSALVLGDRSFLDEDFTSLFTRWHLTHLLAISGLHVGLFVLWLSFMFKRLFYFTKELTIRLLLIIFLLVPFIAGGSPSVFRASLVGLLGYFALSIKWKIETMDALSLVFLFLVIVWPHWIYQLGFQYSFLVTYSLLLSKPIFSRCNKSWQLLLFVTSISFFITLPLQLSRFYYINPVSLLVNPPISLFFSLIIIPLAFLSFFISLFIPSALWLVDPLLTWLFSTIYYFLDSVDRMFYWPLVTGKPDSFHMLCYFIVLFLVLKWIDLKRNKKACMFGLLLFFVVGMMKLAPYLSPFGSVTQLSIGQANVLVIETPHRQGVFIYDIGATVGNDFIEPTDKAYLRIIKPYLHYRGITQVDGVFLSHAHQDHFGSLKYLIKDFKVMNVYTSPYFDDALLPDKVSNTVLNSGFRYNIKGSDFDVLLPVKSHSDENDQSMVIRVLLGPLTFLLTGDISKEIEKDYLDTYRLHSIDVLMVPHHGSSTSTHQAFLEAIQPTYAFISVGQNNSFGHPHDDVLTRLEKKQVIIYRTDTHGAITYRYHKSNGWYRIDVVNQ